MGIEIIKAGPGDLEELIRWRMEVLRDVFAPLPEKDAEPLRKRNIGYYKETFISGGHIACFAFLDGVKVGCGGMCLQREMPSPDNPSGQCAYLMNIYTRPDYRGRGIGGAVVSFLIAEARKRQITKVYLEAAENAVRFYRELGFEPLEGYMKLCFSNTKKT